MLGKTPAKIDTQRVLMACFIVRCTMRQLIPALAS